MWFNPRFSARTDTRTAEISSSIILNVTKQSLMNHRMSAAQEAKKTTPACRFQQSGGKTEFVMNDLP